MSKHHEEKTAAENSEEKLEVIEPETQSKEKVSTEESAEERAKNYYDQLLRLQAEFSNYRKRTEKEKSEAIRFGKEIIVEKMISLMDVIDQALKHSENAKDIQSLKMGFQMVADEFIKFLKYEGVEPLKTVGENFDPHLHEAVEHVESDQYENNKIIEELQKGYQMDGRLIRPARVKVSKKIEKKEEENKKKEEKES